MSSDSESTETEASSIDSPPLSSSQNSEEDVNPPLIFSAKLEPEQVPAKFIERRNLLAALRSLKNDRLNPVQNPFKNKLQSTELRRFKRCCSLDLTTQPFTSWSSLTRKKRLLIYTLTKAVFRHDWSTAARCVRMFLDMGRTGWPFVHRTLLLVLLNHPASNSTTIDNFLNRVLSLRTKSEQLNFLQHSFSLPHDFDEYMREEGILSVEHGGDMSLSEDED